MQLKLSLKYRIALIIFILEAIMMLVVLQQSLGQSYEATSEQIKNNQTAILELVAGISQQALITEEYAELQPYINQIIKQTDARHFILSDHSRTIVATNIAEDIGKKLQTDLLADTNENWLIRDINQSSDFSGQLAIAFSDQPLSKVYKNARDFGVGLALTGMLIIAAIGILVGHLLTRQLRKISETARLVSEGHYEYRTGIDSHDELGLLAHTFDQMVQHFVDNKNELDLALHNVQSREQQLRESEERFRQLAENINEVFWLGSPDWNQIYYISPAYEKDWGRDPEALYSNAREWLNSVHPDDIQQVMDDIPKQIDNQTEYIDFREYRIVKADKSILWIKARAYPIRDQHGQVIRIAGIAENITEQKITEDSLRQAQKMEAVGKLTGGIAHDFNNMLGVILGYAELIEQLTKDKDPKLTAFAQEIYRASKRGANLTQKLLSFSRKRASDTQITDINKQLIELKQMLQKTLTIRISLDYQLADTLWLVNINQSDFEDAIINICINSMHAINDQGSLTISSSNEHFSEIDSESHKLKPGDYVVIRITDTGEGMDTKTLEQVFVPFFSTKGEKGTGLGLSQVYGFMERCGGACKIYSEINLGTRISLYFPRYYGDKSLENSGENKEHEIITGTGTILVVDDETGLLNFAQEVLEQYGYTVFTAENSEEALDVLKHQAVDVLFTDIIMPKMDGYELAAQVSRLYPEVKIQLVSGFNESHHSDKVDPNLKQATLAKPYSANSLLNTIQKLIE